MVFMPNITTNHAITKPNNYNQTVIDNEMNVTLIRNVKSFGFKGVPE